MKRILLSSILVLGMAPAFGADSLWAGPYAGVNVGYGYGRSTTTNTGVPGPIGIGGGAAQVAVALATGLPPQFSDNPNGFLGGAQIGYNWRMDSTVLGIEADIQATNIRGSATGAYGAPIAGFPANSVTSVATKTDTLRSLGTLRGRIGYTDDRWVAYGTAGLAIGDVSMQVAGEQTINGPSAGIQTVIPGLATKSSVRIGWTVGGGLEYALSGGWTVKGEYLYYDLGKQTAYATYTSNILAGGVFSSAYTQSQTSWNGSLVRIGFNYKF